MPQVARTRAKFQDFVTRGFREGSSKKTASSLERAVPGVLGSVQLQDLRRDTHEEGTQQPGRRGSIDTKGCAVISNGTHKRLGVVRMFYSGGEEATASVPCPNIDRHTSAPDGMAAHCPTPKSLEYYQRIHYIRTVQQLPNYDFK